MSDDKFCIKDLTAGQLNALVKKLGRGNIPGILDGTLEVVVSKPLKLAVLGIPSQAALQGSTGSFDPNQFFKTRRGLYIWDSFRDLILPVAKKVESFPDLIISHQPLIEVATDVAIRSELPEGHVWQYASVFGAHLADLIDKQANGEEGIFLNDGRANIFYVIGINGEVFTVSVRWYSDLRRWRVHARRLDDRQWYAGDRAFSAATADS